jgi:hypothetical protein
MIARNFPAGPDIQTSMQTAVKIALKWVILVCSTLFISGTVFTEEVVSGSARSAETGEPLFPATIRVIGSNVATVTNPDGRFEVSVDRLPVDFACSHIGFRSQTMTVQSSVEPMFLLVPVMIELEELVVTAEDPANSIMRKVIERKQSRRGSVTALKANAYSRMTLRKDTTIVSIVETMSEAYWRKGKGWREILKAKRTTRNMQEDMDVPAAAFMEDLSEDDIEIAGHRLTGVTHPDALDTYDFALTGRRQMDDHTVYDISVHPKSARSSAFVGTISVLDDVYVLLDAHLKPNESFIFPQPFRHFGITFHQQFRSFGEAWLPVDLRTNVSLEIGILGFSIPPIRSEQTTRISDYVVNAVFPDSLFKSKKPLISDVSSRSAPDSLLATAGVVIPLSEEEQLAFDQIDSTATLDKVFKPKGALARFVDDDDNKGKKNRKRRLRLSDLLPYGWFNRVDGAYLSVRPQVRLPGRRGRFRAEVGYATSLERWSYGGELWREWGRGRVYRINAGYRRGSSPRQTTNLYSNFNGSTGLFGGDDYFDHYWREEWYAQGRYRIRSLDVDVVPGIRIEKHTSLPKSTDFAILSDIAQRDNPPIDEGRLRSLTFRLTYDGDLGPAVIFGQQKLQIHVEHSRPNLMGSDFDFTQFRFYAGWRFPTFFARRMMPNALDIIVSGGTTTGTLPLQRFGHLDASLERWHNPGTFRALHANPYEGEHYLGVFWEHHFRTLPFEYLGWQALVRRNIGLIVYGGHGRTWISDSRLAGLPFAPQYVDQFHHELGVSVNGLLGLLRIDFTKRLDTTGYTVGVGFARIF